MKNKNSNKLPFKTPLDLSIGYQNIDGLHSPIFDCKLPYLQTKFSHDIEVLSETWGTCDHDKNIPGYKLLEHIKPHKIQNIKKGRSSGGLLIYCRTTLQNYIKKGNLTPYYLWLEVDKAIFHEATQPIRICVMYNPPENSKYCNKDIYEEISLNLFKYSNSDSPILLIGDMNSRQVKP